MASYEVLKEAIISGDEREVESQVKKLSSEGIEENQSGCKQA